MNDCRALALGSVLRRDGAQAAGRARAQGGALQVDPIKPKLKPPGTKRLKLNYDELLSISLQLLLSNSTCAATPRAGPKPPPPPPPPLRTSRRWRKCAASSPAPCSFRSASATSSTPGYGRHPPRSVPVLATSSTTWCIGARHVIHHVVYQCSPRQPPRSVPVLATSSTTWCSGARHVIHHVVYRCSPRHPPHCVPVLATSSTT